MDARLLGVQFPGVEVDADRLRLRAIDITDAPPCIEVRKEAHIRAAGKRRAATAERNCCHGKFRERACRSFHAEREARNTWHPVIGMVDGEDAGIILEAEFHQDIEGPQAALSDRETGGAIAPYLLATSIFQSPLGSDRILAELLG